MADLELIHETASTSMAEARPRLDEALKREFPGGMMKSRWEGDVLHLSGPGAEGTITLEEGQLVGRAALKPPASMMRPLIEKKMTSVLATGAG